jgi:hypothetical protein
MQFLAARPDIVRAINQRWLLTAWIREKGLRRIPLWREVSAEEFSRVAEQLSILQVVVGDGAARFLIRFHGDLIAQAYDSADCRGKHLDEVIPAAGSSGHLAPYYRVLETGQPVYTIHELSDREGRRVNYERLLLPYGRDGQAVDHILAMFEFVCADGAYVRQSLMKTSETQPQLRLSATIVLHHPVGAPDGGVQEG